MSNESANLDEILRRNERWHAVFVAARTKHLAVVAQALDTFANLLTTLKAEVTITPDRELLAWDIEVRSGGALQRGRLVLEAGSNADVLRLRVSGHGMGDLQTEPRQVDSVTLDEAIATELETMLRSFIAQAPRVLLRNPRSF